GAVPKGGGQREPGETARTRRGGLPRRGEGGDGEAERRAHRRVPLAPDLQDEVPLPEGPSAKKAERSWGIPHRRSTWWRCGTPGARATTSCVTAAARGRTPVDAGLAAVPSGRNQPSGKSRVTYHSTATLEFTDAIRLTSSHPP